MSVFLTDEAFNRLVTMHHYAEAAMSLAHASPYDTVGVLRTDKDQDEALMFFNVLISSRVCGSEEGDDPRDGIERIADERMRQLNELGWTDDHDDKHDRQELTYAAAILSMPPWEREGLEMIREMWPWDDTDPADLPPKGKFSDRELPAQITLRRRELEKAGALLAAEIDRLDRLAARIWAEE